MRTPALSGALAAVVLLSCASGALAQEPPEASSSASSPASSEASAVHSDLAEGTPAPPELPAPAYVLADLGSGAILVAKDPHGQHAPASTIKLLTAQTLLPKLDENAQVRAIDDDVRVDGTQIGLVPGSDYSVRQLSEAMLMGSGNDAAHALARTAGGPDGVAGAVSAMNERAAALGARDTVARTPHGLDEQGQHSSAYDLVTILRGALDTPKVAPLLTVRSVAFPGGSKGGSFEVATQNKLLQFYEGAIGGKDGFTDEAGHTYVGAVRRADRTYAVAWLGAPSADWRPSAALLDWAFAHGASARPLEQLPPLPGSADAAQATGDAGSSVGSVLLALLRVLGWTLLALAGAVVLLRVRKLRRDARRRAARRIVADDAAWCPSASRHVVGRGADGPITRSRGARAGGLRAAPRGRHEHATHPLVDSAGLAPAPPPCGPRSASSKPRSTRQGPLATSADSSNRSTANSAV